MTKAHGYSVKALAVMAILVLATLLAPAAPARAVGISMSAGAGVFVAADEVVYGGIGTDLYPEIGGDLEFSMVRLGLKVGAIYRKYEIAYDYDYYYSSHTYTMAFLPVQAELLLAPLAGGKKLPTISPYIGGMAGVFVPVGDNDEVVPAFSLKAGADLNFEPIFIYGDVRYTHASKDVQNSNPFLQDHSVDSDFGGVMVICGIGFRFGS